MCVCVHLVDQIKRRMIYLTKNANLIDVTPEERERETINYSIAQASTDLEIEGR